jgi:hypothetical protein
MPDPGLKKYHAMIARSALGKIGRLKKQSI